MTDVVRMGLLGAARIAPNAVIAPARDVDRVEIVAVAARDVDRARSFAAEHGIARVHDSYEALLADPDIDAVYNALPPSAHHPLTLDAVAAGKHVLCEKPFSCNATQAREMVDAAATAQRVLVEAFHWRYHPLAARLREVLAAGTVGALRSVEAAFCVAIPDTADIRHQLELGGGALMDLGCYAVQWARFAVGSEPEVIGATAVEGVPGIDVALEAALSFPGGVTGTVRCDMAPGTPLEATLTIIGAAGTIEVVNPLAPHAGHELRIIDGTGTRSETVDGRSTYHHQLEAFAAAVLDGATVPTGGDDAVATMAVIDACYRAAGLPPRGG